MQKSSILLPNELFDDGSIECKTFCVVNDEDDTIICEYDYIKKHYAHLLIPINAAIKDGKHYIGFIKDITGHPNGPIAPWKERRQAERRKVAEERNAKYAKLSPQEKINLLDRHGLVATKVRRKIQRELDHQNPKK